MKQAEQPKANHVEFDAASSIQDVVQAWNLVYVSYTRTGLIDSNMHGVHFVPEAIHSGTAVIIGKLDNSVISTMSVYVDRPSGLPLDKVYKEQLDTLRKSGRTLVEVGLFADRRENIKRTFSALIGLMRHVFYYSMHSPATDIVIGVHPDHRNFYERFLAFEVFAHTASCPSVKGNPMVPMRLMLRESLELDSPPRAIAAFKANPLDATAFNDRIAPTREAMIGTAVNNLLIDVKHSTSTVIQEKATTFETER